MRTATPSSTRCAAGCATCRSRSRCASSRVAPWRSSRDADDARWIVQTGRRAGDADGRRPADSSSPVSPEMLSLPQALPLPIPRLTRAVEARLHQVRAHPLLNPVAFEELWRERAGHAVDSVHRPHLLAALEWLERAQDATGAGGVARGDSLAGGPHFQSRGRPPPHPQTTGYIIPALYEAAPDFDPPHPPGRAQRRAPRGGPRHP